MSAQFATPKAQAELVHGFLCTMGCVRLPQKMLLIEPGDLSLEVSRLYLASADQ